MDKEDEFENPVERRLRRIEGQLDDLKGIDDRLASINDRLGNVRTGIFVLVFLTVLSIPERAAKKIGDLALWFNVLVWSAIAIACLWLSADWLKEKWLRLRVRRAIKKSRAVIAEFDRKHGTPPDAQHVSRH